MFSCYSGCKELFVVVKHGVPGDGLVLFGAENQPDGRIIILGDEKVIKHADIAVHLTDILMGEFGNLEVNQQVALQNTVIKNKIDIEKFVFVLKTFLSGDKSKAFSQFQKE